VLSVWGWIMGGNIKKDVIGGEANIDLENEGRMRDSVRLSEKCSRNCCRKVNEPQESIFPDRVHSVLSHEMHLSFFFSSP
jgi:hypothetical protein